jgi:hypothetical protein
LQVEIDLKRAEIDMLQGQMRDVLKMIELKELEVATSQERLSISEDSDRRKVTVAARKSMAAIRKQSTMVFNESKKKSEDIDEDQPRVPSNFLRIPGIKSTTFNIPGITANTDLNPPLQPKQIANPSVVSFNPAFPSSTTESLVAMPSTLVSAKILSPTSEAQEEIFPIPLPQILEPNSSSAILETQIELPLLSSAPETLSQVPLNLIVENLETLGSDLPSAASETHVEPQFVPAEPPALIIEVPASTVASSDVEAQIEVPVSAATSLDSVVETQIEVPVHVVASFDSAVETQFEVPEISSSFIHETQIELPPSAVRPSHPPIIPSLNTQGSMKNGSISNPASPLPTPIHTPKKPKIPFPKSMAFAESTVQVEQMPRNDKPRGSIAAIFAGAADGISSIAGASRKSFLNFRKPSTSMDEEASKIGFYEEQVNIRTQECSFEQEQLGILQDRLEEQTEIVIRQKEILDRMNGEAKFLNSEKARLVRDIETFKSKEGVMREQIKRKEADKLRAGVATMEAQPEEEPSLILGAFGFFKGFF